MKLYIYRGELTHRGTGRLPGEPVSVRIAMAAAVVVIFNYTIKLLSCINQIFWSET